jgi:hypothetical protein
VVKFSTRALHHRALATVAALFLGFFFGLFFGITFGGVSRIDFLLLKDARNGFADGSLNARSFQRAAISVA